MTPNISRKPLIGNPEHYDGDVAEFRQRVEKWLCHFGNSFNAEYSKRGTEDTKYLSTTGAEYGYRGGSLQGGSDEDSSVRLKLYVGGRCEAQAKQSPTGAKYRIAFTLAEVLITLSIIGVVAALTIPSLITKNQEKETVVRLKSAYNIFSNAYSLAKTQYSDPQLWDWGTVSMASEGSIDPFFKISTFLNTTKICEHQGCFPDIFYKSIKGNDYINFYEDDRGMKGILANGMIYRLYSSAGNPYCSAPRGTSGALLETCGALLVDINGAKGPNTLGKDTFEFWITRSAVIPQGTPQDTGAPLKTRCHYDGYGCTAWVLIKENLNYPPDWE